MRRFVVYVEINAAAEKALSKLYPEEFANFNGADILAMDLEMKAWAAKFGAHVSVAVVEGRPLTMRRLAGTIPPTSPALRKRRGSTGRGRAAQARPSPSRRGRR